MTITERRAARHVVDTRGQDLGRLMRCWRERMDPAEIPGLHASMRRKRALSQEDMARLVESSSHWYARLERGDTGIFSPDFLDRTAIALRLSVEERRILYLLAVGHEPADLGTADPVAITRSMQHLVECQPMPCYVVDEAWDVVARNAYAAQWFPWAITGANTMLWAFTHPAARIQLHNWEADWAPSLLAQMMAARARYPRNMRLHHLIRKILELNERAREMWAGGLDVNIQSDVGRRQLNLPACGGITTVEIVTLAPLRMPSMRMVILMAQ